LKSIQKAFSSNEYEKIKIGIGRPNSKDQEEVSNYVLGNFPEGIFIYYNNFLEQLEKIKADVFPKILNYFNIKL